MHKRHVLDFWPQFKCKCGGCRRTCCRDDWEIQLTAEEYDADTSYDVGEECLALAKRGLVRVSNEGGWYARCATDENGLCVLLSGDGLCSWQLRRGECVGAACNEFPATNILWCGEEYAFPSIACEAVLELMLRRETPLGMATLESEAPARMHHVSIGKEHLVRRPLFRFYPELMSSGLTLLQNRQYTLDDRMVLLSRLMLEVHELECTGRIAELPALLDSFSQQAPLQEAHGLFCRHDPSPAALLTVSCGILMDRLKDRRYRDGALRSLRALGFAIEETSLNGKGAYRVELSDKNSYLQRKARFDISGSSLAPFLEQVTVCEYLRGMTPVTKPNVWESFCAFAVWYAFLKSTVYAAMEDDTVLSEVVDALVLMQRGFTHGYDGPEKVRGLLNRGNIQTPEAMIALIKG